MALNVSVFNQRTNRQGAMPHNHNGPPVSTFVLAASTASAAIAGPCELVLIPDEGERVTIAKGAAPGADPAATAMKLLANTVRSFELGAGNWYLRQIAG